MHEDLLALAAQVDIIASAKFQGVAAIVSVCLTVGVHILQFFGCGILDEVLAFLYGYAPGYV